MLAPFTAGWQTTDLHPLVIEKSEVLSFSNIFLFVLWVCSHFPILMWSFIGNLNRPEVSFDGKSMHNCFSFLSWTAFKTGIPCLMNCFLFGLQTVQHEQSFSLLIGSGFLCLWHQWKEISWFSCWSLVHSVRYKQSHFLKYILFNLIYSLEMFIFCIMSFYIFVSQLGMFIDGKCYTTIYYGVKSLSTSFSFTLCFSVYKRYLQIYSYVLLIW